MNMREPQPETRNGEPRAPGIIDTLGNGFALLNRRPYLVWLPVVLDLILWAGFRVSIILPVSWLDPDEITTAEGVTTSIQALREAIASTELVHLVGALTPMLIGDPGLPGVSGLDVLESASVSGESGWALLALGLVLMALIGVTYLTMIGRLVVDRPAWGLRFVGDCLRNTVHLAGAVLATAALVLLMFAPFALIGVGLRLVGVDISAILAGFATVLWIWALVFFFFSAHAITVTRAGAFEAMRASYRLVHRHLLSVLGLLLILLVIRMGMPVALQVFTETQWGVPFAIIVNAYVATGAIAATMLYFLNRSGTSTISPSGWHATAGTRR